MSEELPSDAHFPDPTPDSPNDVASETEVDALLAEAAELAAEVSEELEEIQPAGSALIASQSASSDPMLIPEAGDVDAQLAALDALIDEASQEIGQQDSDSKTPAEDITTEVGSADPDPPSTPPATQQINVADTSDDQSAQAKAPDTEEEMQRSMDSIPDFMQELTEPVHEAPASDSSSTEAIPPAVPEDLSSSSTDAAKTVEQKLLSTGRTRSLAPQSAPNTDQDQTSATQTKQQSTRSRKLNLHIPPKVSETAVSVCDRAVTMLEMIDRPTGRIGERTRVVMGLAALATLGTAIIVFVVSLF